MNPINVRPNGNLNYDFAYFYIDDVEVYEDTVTGIEEPKDKQATLRYDQVQGIITVSGQKVMSVYDMSGRVVTTGKGTLDVSGLSGVYVVQVYDGGLPVHTENMVFMD